jgi:hypothetical protein
MIDLHRLIRRCALTDRPVDQKTLPFSLSFATAVVKVPTPASLDLKTGFVTSTRPSSLCSPHTTSMNALLFFILFGVVTSASAQTCPPAGAAYIIKGFTMETPVTATGEPVDPKWGCKWKTEDNRDLWWKMGEDVIPAKRSPPSPASAGKSGEALQPGRVYTCTLPGIGMFTGAYFGIIDSSTYRDFDGKTGRYSFDASTGVLRMTSGSSKGMAYKRMADNYFRVLDDKGNITGGSCSHATGKRIDGRW